MKQRIKKKRQRQAERALENAIKIVAKIADLNEGQKESIFQFLDENASKSPTARGRQTQRGNLKLTNRGVKKDIKRAADKEDKRDKEIETLKAELEKVKGELKELKAKKDAEQEAVKDAKDKDPDEVSIAKSEIALIIRPYLDSPDRYVDDGDGYGLFASPEDKFFIQRMATLLLGDRKVKEVKISKDDLETLQRL